MQKWWTNFATYHDPNGVDSPTETVPAWPAVDAANPQIMHIEDTSTIESWPDQDKCKFWEELDYGQWLAECNDVYWREATVPLSAKQEIEEEEELFIS